MAVSVTLADWKQRYETKRNIPTTRGNILAGRARFRHFAPISILHLRRCDGKGKHSALYFDTDEAAALANCLQSLARETDAMQDIQEATV